MLGNLSKPAPTKNQSVIKLSYAGLNRRDYWIQQALYPRIDLPVVLGSDGLGIRESDGKSVFFNPAMNWGSDEEFQHHDFQIRGMPSQGTLAEYIAIPNEKIHEVPAHLSDQEGACLPLAGLTAYRGLFVKGKLKSDHKVLITGAGGGVATLGIKMALASGARVFTNSSSDEKIKKAKQWGCEEGWNYRTEQGWTDEANKKTGGFDLILDGAGGDAVKNYINVLKPGGRLVSYGATLGAWTDVPASKIYWKQLHLIGTTMGSDEDFRNMLDFVKEHQLRPYVDRVFDLSEANQAFDYMISPASFGKVVIKIDAN